MKYSYIGTEKMRRGLGALVYEWENWPQCCARDKYDKWRWNIIERDKKVENTACDKGFKLDLNRGWFGMVPEGGVVDDSSFEGGSSWGCVVARGLC